MAKKKKKELIFNADTDSFETSKTPSYSSGTKKKKETIFNADTDSFEKVNVSDFRTVKTKKDPNLADRGALYAKSGAAGAVKGATGIVDAPLQEGQAALEKGKKIKTKKQLEGQAIKTVASAVNPYLTTLYDSVVDPLIHGGKKKKEKANKKNDIVGNVLNATGKSLGMVSDMGPTSTKGLKEALTGYGAVDKSAAKKVKNIRKTVYKPSENMDKEVQKQLNSYNYNGIDKTVSGVTNIVGNMVPSIAATAITKNPTAGLATMGASVKGQATKEAEDKGKSLEEAINIGNAKAGIEVGTEMLTGGLNIFGKGVADDIVEQGINKLTKKPLKNFLLKKGAGIAGEIFEEDLSNRLNAALDRATVDPNAKYTLNDALSSARDTALSTLLLNAIGGGPGKSAYGKNAYKQNANEIASIKAKEHAVQETQNKVKNGSLTPEQGVKVIKEIQDGTYEKKQNLANIAQEKMQLINQAKQMGYITPEQAIVETKMITQALEQERKALNKANQEQSKEQINPIEESIQESRKENSLIDTKEVENVMKDYTSKNVVEAPKLQQQENIENNKENVSDYRGSHQLENTKSISDLDLNDIEKKVVEANGALSKQDTKDLKVLNDIKNKIGETVKIYRASPVNELNNGDWVTTDKEYAKNVANENGGKVYEYDVNTKDLYYPDDVKTLPSLHRLSSFQYNNNLEKQNNEEDPFDFKEKPTSGYQPTLDELTKNDKRMQELVKNFPEEEKKGVAKILEKMPERKTSIKAFFENVKKGYNAARQKITDNLQPVYDYANKTGKKDVYWATDAIQYAPTIAYNHVALHQADLQANPFRNFVDENGKNTTMGLNKIFDSFSDIPLKAKNEFLVHTLNIDKKERGINQFENISLEESKGKVRELKNKYKDINKWANNVYTYNNNLLQLMVDSGIMSEKAKKTLMENNPYYVRIQRDIENYEKPALEFKNCNEKINDPIQRVKGSDAPVLPIRDAMADYTDYVMQIIKTNQAVNKLALSLTSDGWGKPITDMKESMGFSPDFVSKDGGCFKTKKNKVSTWFFTRSNRF